MEALENGWFYVTDGMRKDFVELPPIAFIDDLIDPPATPPPVPSPTLQPTPYPTVLAGEPTRAPITARPTPAPITKAPSMSPTEAPPDYFVMVNYVTNQVLYFDEINEIISTRFKDGDVDASDSELWEIELGPDTTANSTNQEMFVTLKNKASDKLLIDNNGKLTQLQTNEG
eukprot:UN11615